MTKKRRRRTPMEDEQKYPLERVVWVDSCEPGVNAEVELDCVPEMQTIVQVGHLVKESSDAISIAGAWKPGLRTFDYVITIPKVAILQRDRLTAKR